jgi:hypothetical protein
VMPPIDSWAFSRFFCATETSSLLCQVSLSIGLTGLLVPGGIAVSTGWGHGVPATRRWKHCLNPRLNPQKYCGIFKQGIWTLWLFRKQYLFACQQQLSWLPSIGWGSRTKGLCLIYLCKQVTEARSKVWPIYGCMCLYWLLYLQCYVTFLIFTFSKFCLPAVLFPSFLLQHCHNPGTTLLAQYVGNPRPCCSTTTSKAHLLSRGKRWKWSTDTDQHQLGKSSQNQLFPKYLPSVKMEKGKISKHMSLSPRHPLNLSHGMKFHCI